MSDTNAGTVKRPDYIDASCYRIKIEWMSSDTAKERNEFGSFTASTLTIRVDETRDISKQANTLLHEILHAGWWIFNLDEEQEAEERAVTCVANFMSEIWRRNPQAVEWIDYALKSKD